MEGIANTMAILAVLESWLLLHRVGPSWPVAANLPTQVRGLCRGGGAFQPRFHRWTASLHLPRSTEVRDWWSGRRGNSDVQGPELGPHTIAGWANVISARGAFVQGFLQLPLTLGFRLEVIWAVC